MTLKPRLMAIADDIRLSENTEVIYDIGTDHAFLPIWLVKNGYCKRVVATDIRRGPLKKAAENIARFSVEGCVRLHLGDGFDAIPEPGDNAGSVYATGWSAYEAPEVGSAVGVEHAICDGVDEAPTVASGACVEHAIYDGVDEAPVVACGACVEHAIYDGVDEAPTVASGACAKPVVVSGFYVVISGMGGILLSQILERGAKKAMRADTIVLQPMNNQPYLRKWLNCNGYKIKYEKLAIEDRRIYNLMFCVYTGEYESYTDSEYLVGKRFVDCREDVFQKYIAMIIRRLKKAVDGLTKARKNERDSCNDEYKV
ncbi:MAG: class I SAM-dependent methyltransferase [Oscillospiraceae bacterium]|nr:class I SAM-dependent methyltransferase [Oscillospiraceae bacterium]